MNKEALIQVMMTKGHSRSTAEGAISGRGLEAMWNEYMGGGGGAAPTSAEDQVANTISLLTGEYKKRQDEFDPEAARRAAEQEWEPYFEELLQDYLTEVNLGRERSIEDLASGQTLLGERREAYLGEIERESPRIQEQIGGRFADRNLYFSGEREEKQRIQLEKEKVSRGDYDREYEFKTQQAQLSQERYLADVDRQRAKRERDLARDREQAVTNQVQTLREEALAGY